MGSSDLEKMRNVKQYVDYKQKCVSVTGTLCYAASSVVCVLSIQSVRIENERIVVSKVGHRLASAITIVCASSIFAMRFFVRHVSSVVGEICLLDR